MNVSAHNADWNLQRRTPRRQPIRIVVRGNGTMSAGARISLPSYTSLLSWC
ncbi:hypothetical protein ACIBO2_12590 [Nonomuraea sp. NPDC050022]|uniref:hypothetical protein n=1 Tax=unclassified Nonomuraea TaxID=2593643 RepID=UPI0033D342D2